MKQGWIVLLKRLLSVRRGGVARHVIRSASITVLAVLIATTLTLTTTMASIAMAATALIMGGTGHPLSVPWDNPSVISDFADGANRNYITPSGLCAGASPGCTSLAVDTPEQFRFITGLTDLPYDQSEAIGRANLDNCLRGNPCTVTPSPYVRTGDQRLTDTAYTVYGYSSSASAATLEKRYLATDPVAGTSIAFVLVGNPNRPNGGVLERFNGVYIPIIGVPFNGATPTDTAMTTVDVARQYDIVSDFPTNPLNILADINAGFGFAYLHANYFDAGTPQRQGQFGDTTYYLIPTRTLPLLMPLQAVPVIGPTLAAALDPILRVLVETGYDRTINPGAPTTAQLTHFPSPISTAVNLMQSIPIAIDNGIATATGNPALRPLGTTAPASPFGVNGPPVDTGCGTPPCGAPTPVAGASQSMNAMTSSSTQASHQDDQPTAHLVASDNPTDEAATAGSPQLSSPTGLQNAPSADDRSTMTSTATPSAQSAPGTTAHTSPAIRTAPGLRASTVLNGVHSRADSAAGTPKGAPTTSAGRAPADDISPSRDGAVSSPQGSSNTSTSTTGSD